MAKPLKWDGDMPLCAPCSRLYLDPLFVDAIYSVSIDKPHNPWTVMKQSIEAYHQQGHKSE